MVVGTVADDPYFVTDAGDPVRGTWKFRLNLEGVNRVGEVERIAPRLGDRREHLAGRVRRLVVRVAYFAAAAACRGEKKARWRPGNS